MKKLVLFLLSVAAGLGGGPVDPVNKDRAGVALQGYDAVAYFEIGKPVKGRPEFTHSWMNAKWLFASPANRDKFAASPEKHAPQFGGYCSWAVSQGYTAPIDPEAWKIVNGKLYLNYDKSVQKKWERDRDRLITEAERKWPGLHR
jgi:hypothetical protein